MLKTLCVSLAALTAAVAMGQGQPAAAQGKEPYVIYLSNNFVGNDWRQQMQRVAQVSVDKGPLEGQGRPAHRGGRGHRPGADQLAQQHHPAEARRHPRRCRLGLGAQPDDQARLRRRDRRHQLRPGGDRALRLRVQLQLGHDPGGAGRMDGQAARRQGQGHRRPRPRRGADLRTARGRLQDGAREIPRHRGRRRLQRRLRARPGAVRRRRACSPPTRRSTAS